MGRPTVLVDLEANPELAKNLAAGGGLVPVCTHKIYDEVILAVRARGNELRLPARVVYVDPAKNGGLELIGFNPAMKDQLSALIGSELAPARTTTRPITEPPRTATRPITEPPASRPITTPPTTRPITQPPPSRP